MLGIMKDASSTSGELANAASKHVHGVRNAAEADRGRPALLLDGACSASPRRRLAVRPRLAPCKVGPNSGKTRQEAANSGKTRQEAADSGWSTPPL